MFEVRPERSEGSFSPVTRSFEAQDARGAHFEPGTLNAPLYLTRFVDRRKNNLQVLLASNRFRVWRFYRPAPEHQIGKEQK